MSSNTAPKRQDFPADFRWGVSTSSFQIEGAGREDGKGESIWDRFCSEPGRIRDGSDALVACDHYHLWPQDLDMAKRLGVNAYRFSIAWPRILPQGRGAVNEAGLAFYDRLVDGMLERGLDPWATLYHWDLPQALQVQGGWTSRDTVAAFLEYTDVVTRRLGDRVKHWITHNEPWCSCMMGYWEGVHAPGGKSLADAMQACHHVLLSHGQAIPLIRANSPAPRSASRSACTPSPPRPTARRTWPPFSVTTVCATAGSSIPCTAAATPPTRWRCWLKLAMPHRASKPVTWTRSPRRPTSSA